MSCPPCSSTETALPTRWYSFDEMRTIDLRHYKDMTLADYIALYQPDVVVGIRDYESLLSTDYNGSPFEIQP